MELQKHIPEVEEAVRQLFCSNLDVLELLPESAQQNTRSFPTFSTDYEIGIVTSHSVPGAYCQKTGEPCVAVDDSWWNFILGKIVVHDGIRLNKRRLYLCHDCDYAKKKFHAQEEADTS